MMGAILPDVGALDLEFRGLPLLTWGGRPLQDRLKGLGAEPLRWR
jgi:hypothetical protein